MPSKGGKDGSGLSQEQMLWGVLALLCTAVVCFAAGILVNKIQSRPQVATSEPGQVERLPGAKEPPVGDADRKERSPDKSEKPDAAEGVQVSPAPVAMPLDGSMETAPPSRPVTQREPNTQFVPAPPPQRDDKGASNKDETEPKPTQEQPAAPTPVDEAPKPADEAAMQTTTAPAPEPLTPATENLTSETATSGFTIQVGSFDTLENAEKFKKSIERKSDFDIVLYPVKDSQVVKACIGAFDTKEAAAKEREQLNRIKDFSGCFVKPLSEL